MVPTIESIQYSAVSRVRSNSSIHYFGIPDVPGYPFRILGYPFSFLGYPYSIMGFPGRCCRKHSVLHPGVPTQHFRVPTQYCGVPRVWSIEIIQYSNPGYPNSIPGDPGCGALQYSVLQGYHARVQPVENTRSFEVTHSGYDLSKMVSILEHAGCDGSVVL